MERRHQHKNERDIELDVDREQDREAKPQLAPGKRTRTQKLDVDPRVPDLRNIRQALGALRTGGKPLAGAMTAEYSRLLGLDLSGVRIHQGGAAGQAARDLSATAFTAGTNIGVVEQLDLDSAHGRHVIAHELVHVAQNLRGGGADVAARLEIGPSGSAIEAEAERGARAITRGEAFAVGTHARLPGISRYGGDEDPNVCAPPVPGANPPPGQSSAPNQSTPTPNQSTPPASYTPATPPPAPPAQPAPAPAPAPSPTTPGGQQPGGQGGAGGAHPTRPAPAPGSTSPAPNPGATPGGTPRPSPQPAPSPTPRGDLDGRVKEELEKRADPTLKGSYSKAVGGVDALRIQALQFSFQPNGIWNTVLETFTARNAFQDHAGQIYSANAYRGGRSWVDTAQAWIEGLRGVIHIVGDIASVVAAWAGMAALVTGALALVFSETVIGGIALGAIAAIAAEVATVAGAIKLLTDIIDFILGILQMVILVIRARNSKDPGERARFAQLLRKEANDFGSNVVSIGMQVAVMAASAGVASALSKGTSSFMNEFTKLLKPVVMPRAAIQNIVALTRTVAPGAGVAARGKDIFGNTVPRQVLAVEVRDNLVQISALQRNALGRVTSNRQLIPFTTANQMRGARLVTARAAIRTGLIVNTSGFTIGLAGSQIQSEIKQPRGDRGGTSSTSPSAQGNRAIPKAQAGADLTTVQMWPSQIEMFENSKGPIGGAVSRTQRQYEMAESQAGPELAGQVRAAFQSANNASGQARFGAMAIKSDAAEGQANTQRGLQQTAQGRDGQNRMGQQQDAAGRSVTKIQGEGGKLQSPPPKEGVLGWLYNQTIGRIGKWIGDAQKWVTNLVGKWAMSLAGFSKEEMDIAGIENDMREDDKKDQTSTQDAQDAALKADEIQQTVFRLQENKTRDEQAAIQGMADAQRFIMALEDADRRLAEVIASGKTYVQQVTPIIQHEMETEEAGSSIDAAYVAPVAAYAGAFASSIDSSNLSGRARTDITTELGQMKASFPDLDIGPGQSAATNAISTYETAFGQLAGAGRAQAEQFQTAIQAFIGTTDYEGVNANARAIDKLAADFDRAAQQLVDQLYASLNGIVTQYNTHIQHAIDAANAVPDDPNAPADDPNANASSSSSPAATPSATPAPAPVATPSAPPAAPPGSAAVQRMIDPNASVTPASVPPATGSTATPATTTPQQSPGAPATHADTQPTATAQPATGGATTNPAADQPAEPPHEAPASDPNASVAHETDSGATASTPSSTQDTTSGAAGGPGQAAQNTSGAASTGAPGQAAQNTSGGSPAQSASTAGAPGGAAQNTSGGSPAQSASGGSPAQSASTAASGGSPAQSASTAASGGSPAQSASTAASGGSPAQSASTAASGGSPAQSASTAASGGSPAQSASTAASGGSPAQSPSTAASGGSPAQSPNAATQTGGGGSPGGVNPPALPTSGGMEEGFERKRDQQADPAADQQQAAREEEADEASTEASSGSEASPAEESIPPAEEGGDEPAATAPEEAAASTPTANETAAPTASAQTATSSSAPTASAQTATSSSAPEQAVQRRADGTGMAAASPVDVATQATQGSGGSLPHLGQIQASFGRHDVSGIRYHDGSAAQEGATALGARAFAVGDAVAFKGAPDLHTAAHEAAHVVQQRAGMRPSGGIDGGAGDTLERHADAVADAVAAGRSAQPLLDQIAGRSPQAILNDGAPAAGVQRKTAPTITKMETRETSADNSGGRTRTVIGVGEIVDLEGSVEDGTWTATGGLIESSGKTATFTAPGKPNPGITIKLKNADGEVTKALSVIAPSKMRFKNTGAHAPSNANMLGSGMALEMHVEPMSVCFSNILIREKEGGASALSGYFAGVNADGREDLNHYPGGKDDNQQPKRDETGALAQTFSHPDTGNKVGIDDASLMDDETHPWARPFSVGSMTWQIPYLYTGDAGEVSFTIVTQTMGIVDSRGTVTVTKGAASQSRTPSQPLWQPPNTGPGGVAPRQPAGGGGANAPAGGSHGHAQPGARGNGEARQDTAGNADADKQGAGRARGNAEDGAHGDATEDKRGSDGRASTYALGHGDDGYTAGRTAGAIGRGHGGRSRTAAPAPPAPTGPVTITHTPEFSAVDGTADDRTTVGVGEKITFEADRAGTWSSTAVLRGRRNRGTGRRYVWTAPSTASSATITFDPGGGGAQTTIGMTVIAPQSIQFIKFGSEDTFRAGTMGAGFHSLVKFEPFSVVFAATQWKEVGGPASNASGYFAGLTLPRHRPNPHWLSMDSGNGGPTDHAAFWGFRAPWTTGHFEWEVPNKYRVRGEGGEGYEFTRVIQSCDVQGPPAAGTTTVTKGAGTATRAPGTAPARPARRRGHGYASSSQHFERIGALVAQTSGHGRGWGVMGRMGPGGGGFGPADPQIDPFKYFEQYGKRHFAELNDLQMGAMTLETGSPYAAWVDGSSKTFLAKLAYDLYTANVPPKPIDLAEQTLAPQSVATLIQTGRDAENRDDRKQANEYHLGVTLELQKAYRTQLHDALTRLMPRLIREWNRRTLADWAARSKDSPNPQFYTESPETNQPGVGLVQSHPIDRFVLGALWGHTHLVVKPDFAGFRKDFPSEGKPNGPRDRADELRHVKFEWQVNNNARRWIKVTDPIDATIEEVAKELFGSSTKAYLITAAAPLFGLDMRKDGLVEPYESQHYKQYGDPKTDPGNSVPNQIVSGPLANDAALNQAAKFTADKVPPAVVLQQFDLLIDELRKIAGNQVFALRTKEVAATVSRVEKRRADVAAANATDQWNAQVREQLDIASKSQEGLGVAAKMYTDYTAQEAKNLAWELGLDYIEAATNSDLVVTSRQKLNQASQRLVTFPSDWVEAQFRWIKRALLASRKNAKTGADDPFVKDLEATETKLRLDLMKVRDKLFTDPLGANADVEKITAELQKLATGASAVRNIDLCNEAFVQLKEAKSATGWIRSLASNPLTGDHGNDRLDSLAGRADKFQGEWDAILKKWRDGKQDEAATDLQAKAETKEWKEFFDDVAKEIKDQGRYDAWMTFAILVGIAIATGFVGALVEPLAVAAAGPILGFVLTVGTEAAVFTSLSYAIVEKHPTLQGFKNEFVKNVIVFGVMKGISKLFAGMEKVLAVELKEAEVITQFATVNGIALHDANKEKARRGETLTEGEILKISFDNLVFAIAVAIGGKALAPAFGRWRLKGEVGKSLKEIETLHAEVLRLQETAKTTKDKVVGERMLQRQRELLTAERQFLEGLLELTTKGRDAALKKGMTGDQYDALMKAQQDLGAAAQGLREAEIMSTLEPVTRGQYLVEPGKPFEEAHKHYSETNPKGTAPVTGDAGARTFEVTLPDGSTMRISERAGKKGQVNTNTQTVNTPSGDVPPRAEEVAKAHNVIDPTAVTAFEALYKAHPQETLAFLEATKAEPGLANKLFSMFGEHTLSHFKPTSEGLLDIHGEIDISSNKLSELMTRKPADIQKLVELGKNKGPKADYEYFETTSTNLNKPGSRLRFRSRLESRAKEVAKKILDSLHITDAQDPRAKLFENMAEGDAVRLWDLVTEKGYTDAAVRKQAADWALGKKPASVREFVAEFQFYDAEVTKRGERIVDNARDELAIELGRARASKPGGTALTAAENIAVTRRVTQTHLGRALDVEGAAWRKAGYAKAATEMSATTTDSSGKATTVGAQEADVAWKANTDTQVGGHAAGARSIGIKSDLELPDHVRSNAETLSFGNSADAAYHAHKHASELPSKPSGAGEMTAYLDAARSWIKNHTGRVRHNQNGSRSVVFEDAGMRAIVNVTTDGKATISTFGKAN